MSTKPEKQITIAEAIEQGYKYFCEDGGEVMLHLQDYPKVPYPPDEQIYWLIDKEPTHYTFSGDEIKEAIINVVEGQEEFADEDGELCDMVDEVYEEWKDLFDKISYHLNERFEKKRFLMPLNIQVV